MEVHSIFLVLFTIAEINNIFGQPPSSASDVLPGFRDLFTRYGDKRLSSLHADFLSNTTLASCTVVCVSETQFQCKSFGYDNVRRSCFLYSVNLDDPDVHLIDSAERDHYETSYLKKFTRLPNHEVRVTTSQQINAVSREECARRCILETRFKCRGFNYRFRGRQNQCLLVESTPATSSIAALLSDGNDFFQKEPETSMSSFINYGMGLLRPNPLSEVYERSIRGISVEACAQACLDEKPFSCLSFDYVNEDNDRLNLCHLSKYIAANVQGLVVDTVNPRHNHFERIERFLGYFYPTPFALIQGNNLKTFSKVTPNRCAKHCMEEDAFVCRSFDYRVVPEATCLLSSKTARDVGGLDTTLGRRGSVHHFEMKPILDCGGNLTASEGGLASPNWPRNYAHHENCVWNIQVSQHKVILLRFTHFELGLQSSDSCSDTDDRLIISETGFKPYCVMPNTKRVITKTNQVAISFFSNAQVDAQGFRAFYSAGWTCDVNFKTAPGEFASPKWPGNYPSGSRCSWRVTAPDGQQVHVTFTSFELERHTLGHCNEKLDHVRILDGGTVGSPLIGLYCGSHDPFAIRSSGRDIFVQFVSDNDPHNSRQGFHASFVFESVNGTIYDADSRYIDLGQTKDRDREWEGTEEEDTRLIGAQLGSQGADDNNNDNSISSHYRSVIWSVITCLIVIILILAVALYLVVRHYRQKLSGQDEKVVEDGGMASTTESVPLQMSFRKKQHFNNVVDLSGASSSSSAAAGGQQQQQETSCDCVASDDEAEVSLSSSMPRPPPRTHRPTSSYGKYHEDNLKNMNLDDKSRV